MKKTVFFAVFAFFCGMLVFSQTNNDLPEGRVRLFDGFEHGNYWIWAGYDHDQWGTHKYSDGTRIRKNWASEGSHSLECIWEVRPAGVGYYGGTWFYDGTQDLTGTKYIAVDIYIPSNIVMNIYLVIQSTNEWKWQQCNDFDVGRGVHTLVFDVREFADDLHDVKRINLEANTTISSTKEESFYIDNIRLIN